MNVIKEIERITHKELEHGIYGGSGKGSWHEKYKNSAWVYVGGLSYELSEGDIICFMSQWGEIEDINVVREQGTNKSKGFAFVKYEDQRSTILAVDNFNGIKLLGRVLRVDHVDKYKLPKEVREREEERLEEDPEADVSIGPGHAYKDKELENAYSISQGQDLWSAPSISGTAKDDGRDSDVDDYSPSTKHGKRKRSKHSDKHKKKKHKKDHRRKDELPRRDGGDHSDSYAPPLEPPVPTSVPLSAVMHSTDAPAASWRGRKDPALAAAAADYERKMKFAEKAGPQGARRDEFSGFGGMNRRR
mmetsp:Transcript_3073/g.4723  ORF Transcript_3073/g.4723 Transcript_3073/m.4723 type:complete len:303 (+) Transcript_3073:25-933(+)